MKKRLAISLCFVLFLGIAAWATNLRGRVLRYDPVTKSYSPLTNARVDMVTWNGKSWVNTAYAITGKDGFYHFVNMHPGAQFRLQVLGKYYPPQPLFIQNIATPYYQDVPQIVL